MFTRYYDEYKVEDRYVSRGRTMTEADIVNFAGLSGDFYPLHMDLEYAKRTEFGQRIAHGMLVLSIATGLVPIAPDVIVAFYGMDEVRFITPTFIGDTLHVEAEVIEKRDRGPGGILSVKEEIVKQTGEVAAVCILRTLVRSRANAIAGNAPD